MLGYVFLIGLQLMSGLSIIDSHPAEDKELVLAFVVNRKGERTPAASQLSLSDRREKLINLTKIEVLTNTGKRRAYLLGKFIRQRYGSEGYGLLSNIYLQDEIALRSTDKDRTKMTAQLAMAAVYPPEVEQQWDDGLGKVWQPVPYTAVPMAEDYLCYHSNCKHFKDLMEKAKVESANQEFAKFRDVITIVKNETGKNFTEEPILFQDLFELFQMQMSLGLGIPKWAAPILPKFEEAATLAYKLYFRYDQMKKIGGGVILNDFITAADDIASGKVVKKRFRMYSAHDFNIGSLMEVTKAIRDEQNLHEYGALFGLEMYRSKSTGAFTVMPIYLPKAGESTVKYLHFRGCETSNHCDLERFKNSTKEYLLPEKEFYSICGIRTEL